MSVTDHDPQPEEQDPQSERTAQQLAALYEEHDRSASLIQRGAIRVTDVISRPASLTIVIVVVLAWMIGNYMARYFGSKALEEFPFPDLAFLATLAAFIVALLILTTQRHEDALAEKRARLTLQIAVLSEKKIAKVIALLEEQRRDNPMLQTRVDQEADEMAQSSRPEAHMEQIEARQAR